MKKGIGKKKNSIIIGMFFIMAGFLISKGTVVFADTEDTIIYEGIYIDDIPLGGVTKEEAQNTIEEYVDKLQDKQLILSVGDKTVSVNMKELDLKISDYDIVEEAYELGKNGNIIERYKNITDIKNNEVHYQVKKEVDTSLLDKILKKNKDYFVTSSKNATIERVNGEFQITKEVVGQKINRKETIKKLDETLEDFWSQDVINLAIVVETDEPECTAEDLAQIKEVLGSFSTNFSTSNAGRVANVVNGANLINGTVVYPGEEFSTALTVQPFTEENGYYMAGSYLNGEVVDSLGGGICQVSTTLYNAILRAELEVTQRAPHSMTVNYVKLSEDAAIAGDYKDFKFKNNLEYPIYIEGYAGGGTITFKIYGHETRDVEHRSIEFDSELVETLQPGAAIVTYDSNLTEGVRQVTKSAKVGYYAKLWKKIYIDGVLTETVQVNSSTYQAIPEKVTVGTKKIATTAAPTTEQKTEAPATEAPATEAPKTEATTVQETTQAPVTEAPATEAPKVQEETVPEEEIQG